MYLSKLELRGFKSFANKTELIFKPGLTCIVGPNGSGKTNIVDAIRWVLGEQRAGVLRSDKMDKVIFAGSSSQKPLGMAEVSMTIQNDRSVLPSEYTEVVVTRRLYRSGESEYLLNKRPCRLKDINDLFLDTGMGPDSYSVIELKMVESILSSKTEDKLRLFEEAAGINKYKHRRAAALRKLNATQEDLNRVNDIISEVERTVNSLKRQVKKAERYQQLSKEIEELDLRHAALELGKILRQLRPLKQQLEQQQQAFQTDRSRLSKDEAILEKMRAEMIGFEDRLSSVQSDLDAVVQKIHSKENELTVAKERIRSLKEKITRYRSEKEQIKKRQQLLLKRLDESRPKLQELREISDGYKLKFRLKKEELDGFEKILNRRRLEANENRMKLVELLKELDKKEKEKSRHESQSLLLSGRKEQLEKELREAEKEVERLKAVLAEQSQNDSAQEKEHQKLQKDLTRAEEAFAQISAAVQETREALLQLKTRLDGKLQQRNFFQHVIEVNEGFPDGVRFLLERQRELPGLLGPVGDLLNVPEKYRRAVEAILAEMASYLVVEKASQAYKAVEWLREKKLGHVTFIVLEWFKKKKTERPAIRAQGVLGWADELVSTGKPYRDLVAWLLGSYLIVEDDETRRRIFEQQGVSTVTLAGELTSSEGVLRSGSYEQGNRTSNIARKSQLEEIVAEIEALEAEQIQLQKKLAEQNRQFEERQADLERKNQALKQYEQAHFEKRVHLEKNRDAAHKMSAHVEQLKKELATTEHSIEEAYEKINRLMPAIEDLLKQKARYERESQKLLKKVQELESERNELAEEVHELNLNLVRTTSELKSVESEIERLGRTVKDLSRTLAQRDREIGEAETDIAHFEEVVEKTHTELAAFYERRETLVRERNDVRKMLEETKEKLQVKEAEVKRAREAGESSSDQLRNLKLQISELDLKQENIRSNINEKYAIQVEPATPKSPGELEEISERLELLRRRLQNFGPVNLLSLEEYEKESKRLEFLEKQRDDLLDARRTLLETISVINKTAHDRFYDIFQKIRTNFRANFRAFFDGGEGDLQIRFDPDDPLEAEIKIKAKPGGKEISSMDLLSAGEKALTAIALLFSIYQVKPSPFCVLDEVDAPLDDQNLRRFLKVVRDFSDTVQFILVTHNKVTMEASDNIYGVTMAEEGVSRLVSVRFAKADDPTALEIAE